MNDKIQAILLKLVVELKNYKWITTKDWEINLKATQSVDLIKNISVDGEVNGADINESIETSITLKLATSDEITYYPEFDVYAQIFIDGGPNKDVLEKMDADIAFTQEDFKDDTKLKKTAKRINDIIEENIENQFGKYSSDYSDSISALKGQGSHLGGF